MPRVSRLFHTVRHLRVGQVLALLRHRLRSRLRLLDRHSRTIATLRLGQCKWRPRTTFLAPGPQTNQQCQILAGRLNFLNHRAHVGFAPQWNPEDVSRLWGYDLHYHEYLWALDIDHARQLADRPDQREALGSAGHDYVMHRFDRQQLAHDYTALLTRYAGAQ